MRPKKKLLSTPRRSVSSPLVNLILFPKFCLNFIKPDVWLPAVAVSAQSWLWSCGTTTCRGLLPAYFWDCCCHGLKWSWATRIFTFFHTLYVLDTLHYVVWELKSSPQVILEQCLYYVSSIFQFCTDLTLWYYTKVLETFDLRLYAIFSLDLDRVGGRLDSAELKTATGNDRWDVGGQWVAR